MEQLKKIISTCDKSNNLDINTSIDNKVIITLTGKCETCPLKKLTINNIIIPILEDKGYSKENIQIN